MTARESLLRRSAALLLGASLLLAGCASSNSADPLPTGTDLWAGEPIVDAQSAKRVISSVLIELIELAPEDQMLPAESQPPKPGETPRRLGSCSERNYYYYPAATAVFFKDEASARAYESVVREYLGAQEGWETRQVTNPTGGIETVFVSANRIVLTVEYDTYRGRQEVVIWVDGPCFPMPEDFNSNTERI